MRTRRVIPALLAALLAPVVQAHAAQPPQIEAQVSATDIALDEPVKLVVTISRDASQQYQSYSRPDSKDFDVVSQSEFEHPQWSTLNGAQVVRSVEQHVYVLRPKRKGTITIPSAVVRIDGRELKTREIVVSVSAVAKKPAGPGAPAAGPSAALGMPSLSTPEGMTGSEDVFAEARVETVRPAPAAGPSVPLPPSMGPPVGAPAAAAPAASPGAAVMAHVGEQLLVTWMLYTRAEIWKFSTTSEPRHEEFWSEELYAPKRLAWQMQTINGRQYQAYVLNKTALFPLRAGKLVVSPRVVEVTTAETAFYPGASAQRASRSLAIDVLPLPAAGRPDGFDPANVGRYDIVSSIDNTHPKAGEAITLRVVLKGQGNLRNVKLPKIDHIEGFKVYEPTAVDAIERKEGGVEGTKALTYLLLPRKGGPLTVPGIELPYYDPVDARYVTTVAPAINITVEGDPEKIGTGGPETKENLLAPRIKPLRIKRHLEWALGERILRGPALLVCLAAPPALLALIVVGGTVRARLRRETAGSRRRRARAAARRHLRAGELHIKGARPSAFFAECARAIYEHLEYRLGMRFESYTIEELGKLLVERGFDSAVAASITEELSACDFARFSTADSGPSEMRAALRRVKQLLEAIERARLPGAVKEAA